MGEMRDSDWSRKFLLRSDWLPIHVASMTTLVDAISDPGDEARERFFY